MASGGGVLEQARILVDPEDVPLLASGWNVYRYRQGRFYAERRVNGKTQYLHRLIAGAGPGEEVDHINGDGLDNRRANLRVVSHAENAQNQRKQAGRSSKHRGVGWFRPRGVWRAYAELNGRFHHIGYFEDEDAAGRAATEWRAANMPFSADALALGAVR